MSLIIRVDDYPGTKPEEFWRHNLESFKKFYAVMEKHRRDFVLGIIPRHTKPGDLKWLADQPYVSSALHGINHDERFPNEFREHQTEDDIYQALQAAKSHLEASQGSSVDIYIPPHNVFDSKTGEALRKSGFLEIWGGPGSDLNVVRLCEASFGLRFRNFAPPFLYGRSDELTARGAHEAILGLSEQDDVYIGLHWTWEYNAGLDNLDRFLGKLKSI